MAHTCNPSALGDLGGWITMSRDQDHPGEQGETPSLLKIQKISWAWWHVPVIPATQEAEAGELPEPRRWRLRWAEIAPLHSSLGDKSETPSQNKQTNSQTFFQSGCILLYSHQQLMRVSVAPHLCQYLVLSIVLIWVILIGMYCFNWHFPDDRWLLCHL